MDGTIRTQAHAVAELRDRLRAAYGEQVDEATLLDAIEGETDFLEIVRRALRAINDDTAFAAAIQAQEIALAGRRKRIEQRAEKLRAILADAMETANVRSLKLPEATLSLRAVAPSVILTDEEALPPSFWITPPPKPDKKAIGAALKEGREVPGASLSNGSTTLSIRSN